MSGEIYHEPTDDEIKRAGERLNRVVRRDLGMLPLFRLGSFHILNRDCVEVEIMCHHSVATGHNTYRNEVVVLRTEISTLREFIAAVDVGKIEGYLR